MTKTREEYIKSDVENVWHHVFLHKGQPPLILTEGNGLVLKDIDGKEYLDATSGGVWCVNVGYGRERIAKVVYDQMIKMAYYTPACGNLPLIDYAEKILGYTPGLSRVFLSNSGSEANEKAFKMVRLRAHNIGKPQKKTILYRYRDYHGTTLATLSACGHPERKVHFEPLLPGFTQVPDACCYRCPFEKSYPSCNIECAKAIEDAIVKEGPDNVGGLVLETITAGGGIIPPVKEYYKEVRAICDKYDVLLIMDEVVCGMGRTGTMFGYHHYDFVPDMIVMGKGVANAYMPVSCTITKEDIFSTLQNTEDAYGYFRDISTYGGCAAGPVAGTETIKIIEEENLLANATEMGAYFLEGLRENLSHSKVGDVRGKGLFCGIEFVEDKKSKAPLAEATVLAVRNEMAAQGVLAGRTFCAFPGQNNIMHFAPALTITKEQCDTVLRTMRDAIKKVLG